MDSESEREIQGEIQSTNEAATALSKSGLAPLLRLLISSLAEDVLCLYYI